MDFSRIVELDLGRFTPAPDSDHAPLVTMLPYEPFNTVAQARKRFVGPCCPLEKSELAKCVCTFKERFLDRWTCLRCHLNDWGKDQDYHQSHFVDLPGDFNTGLESHWRDAEEYGLVAGGGSNMWAADSLKCICGMELETCFPDEYVTLCSWCWGRLEDEEEAGA